MSNSPKKNGIIRCFINTTTEELESFETFEFLSCLFISIIWEFWIFTHFNARRT